MTKIVVLKIDSFTSALKSGLSRNFTANAKATAPRRPENHIKVYFNSKSTFWLLGTGSAPGRYWTKSKIKNTCSLPTIIANYFSHLYDRKEYEQEMIMNFKTQKTKSQINEDHSFSSSTNHTKCNLYEKKLNFKGFLCRCM